MTPASENDLTDDLLALGSGASASEAARQRLFERLYPELRRMAGQIMRGERSGHTLSPTDIVHDAFLRLVNVRRVEARDRGHFLAISGRVMRQVLVDYSRRRNAAKRGGGANLVTLSLDADVQAESEHGIIEIHEALNRLAEVDARAALVAEARLFAGMTVDEIATSLDVSRRTIDGDWLMARRWLTRELTGGS